MNAKLAVANVRTTDCESPRRFCEGWSRTLCRSMAFAVGAIAWACLTPSAEAQTIPDAQFQQLFQNLDSNVFQTREQAEKDLTAFATGRRLTGAQIAQLQQAALGKAQTSLEVAVRAQRIFDQLVRSLPAYKALYDKVQAQIFYRAGDPFDRASYRFKFDTASGPITGNPPPGNPGNSPTVRGLLDRWEPVRKALAEGNIDALKTSLQNLRTYVNGLGNQDVLSLVLDPGGNLPRLTKADLLQRIDDALNLVQQFQQQLMNANIQPNPGAAAPIPVNGAGRVELGQSFGLQIRGDVAITGSLAFFSPDDLNALALPIDGFQYVGHIFDLQATDSLLVGGTIQVSIEYGDVQLIGHPVIDPAQLQFIRIANSQAMFLVFTNDLSGHVLTATYQASTADQGLDQFGEFAILQPVPTPQPGTLALSIFGVLCLLGRAWWRCLGVPA